MSEPFSFWDEYIAATDEGMDPEEVDRLLGVEWETDDE